MSSQLTFVYPGDLNTRTGGYRYDKRIVEQLVDGTGKAQQWNVSLVSLEGDYPFPSAAQCAIAAARFNTIPDNTITVIDGLAYSVLPEIIASHAHRLIFVALIHHPLALETGLSEENSARLRALETEALRYASFVITTSESTAHSLVQYKVPADKIKAVLPGTDTAPIANGSVDAITNILCVATLTQRKGHDVLLEALASIVQLPWRLHCVGSIDRDISHYQNLIKTRKRFALDTHVTFTGELDEEELNRHYAMADVFVLASFHEGYGMVLSEAISRGIPIICSDAGAMRDTVPEGAGILVPPGESKSMANALHSYLTDASLRTTLKKAAITARQNLRDWQIAADEFSEVLTQTQLTKPPTRNV
ncbi:MAG: glycosyltransferase family 4 protein [Granulosicoccus sp.]